MCVCVRSEPPLNNQLIALATLHVTPTVSRRQSLLVGGGPPRGITLSRQNSISSQMPACDKSTPRVVAVRRQSLCPSPALQPANDARTTGDKTATSPMTSSGDTVDIVSGENVTKNLEVIMRCLQLRFDCHPAVVRKKAILLFRY